MIAMMSTHSCASPIAGLPLKPVEDPTDPLRDRSATLLLIPDSVCTASQWLFLPPPNEDAL
jgi:hypothetical protein